jgi:hypothetical protein
MIHKFGSCFSNNDPGGTVLKLSTPSAVKQEERLESQCTTKGLNHLIPKLEDNRWFLPKC